MALTKPSAGMLGAQINKNALINGAFEVWQRGTSFAAVALGAYTADRWTYIEVGDAVHTISRSTDVPTVAQAGVLAPYSILIDCTTADGSVAAGDGVHLTQPIEGYVWRPFAQRTLTLSFWVKATKTGTYCVSLRNGSGGSPDRSYVAEYTVSVADTWEKKTVTFTASPSAGNWDYTTSIGAYLTFALMAGTDFQTTANAWQTGNYFATSNQVNACDSTDNNFRLALVQLEVGDTATDFECVPFDRELERCKRYYQKSFWYTTTPAQNIGGLGGAYSFQASYSSASAMVAPAVPLTPIMRSTAPTVTFYNPLAANAQVYNGSTGASCTATSATVVGDARFSLITTLDAGVSAGHPMYVNWTASAEL